MAETHSPAVGGAIRIWLGDAAALLSEPGVAARCIESWCRVGLVSPAEQARARTYRHEAARLHFLLGRALVRHALAQVGGYDPAHAQIVESSGGKPALVLPDGRHRHFNISHSGKIVACALADSPVGIDVETTDRIVDWSVIAATHFAPQETRWLGNDARSAARFTALWTLKEACLKAMGTGLSVPLRDVTVSAVRLRSCRMRTRQSAKQWYCRVLRPLPGYWMAVCSDAAMGTLEVEWSMPGCGLTQRVETAAMSG